MPCAGGKNETVLKKTPPTYFEVSDLKYILFPLLYKAPYLLWNCIQKNSRWLLIFKTKIKKSKGWGMSTGADLS
jgi:hypothetical protein